MSSFYYDPVSEVAQVQELANFLSKLNEDKNSDRTTDYKKLVESQKLATCMQRLASDSDVVFQKATDSEIVAFFALFGTLSLKLGAQRTEVDDLLSAVVNRITSISDRKQIRLQVLSDLFNLDAHLPRRFRHLLAIFKYATETDQTEVIQQSISSLDEWVFELQLDKIQSRQLIAAVLPGIQDVSEACDLLVKFLGTFDVSDNLVEYQDFIEKRLIDFVKVSGQEVSFDEIFDCTALSSLKSQPIYELVEIFVSGSFREWDDFQNRHKKYLIQHGIHGDTCLSKIRQGTLIGLCSSKRTITYAEVANALGIPEDDVEDFIIDSVTQGIVDLRLNQPSKTILVRYVRQRRYEKKEWEQLGDRVDQFKANVLGLIDTLKSASDIPNITV